jgi:hypothetical protein
MHVWIHTCFETALAPRREPALPASSHGSEAIQVCDLLAGVRRRAAEGDANMRALDSVVQAVRARCSPGTTVKGRAFSNVIFLF